MLELLRDVVQDVTSDPLRLAAEVVQFLLLVGALWWASRRFVGRKLAERRAKIAADLAEAQAAEQEHAGLRDEAEVLLARAEREAPDLIRAAREEAQKEREASIGQAEADARERVSQARQSVQGEKDRVVREASERLTRLTTETARRYLEEMLTESERRTLTQKAILEALEGLERGSAPRVVE